VGLPGNLITQTYDLLLKYYGEQSWWPADDHFEIMIGAILTQNTAWTNVEKAIINLKQAGVCNSQAIAELDQQQLAELIRPSGYFNQKAARLIDFAIWYRQQGGYDCLNTFSDTHLRESLLRLKGIGDETADDIVLYAFNRSFFVIDTYTRRLFSRLGFCIGTEKYTQLQHMVQQELSADVAQYQQYHALIVAHAKRHCRKKPDCKDCPLALHCYYEHEQKQT
jgi:endonuclease-3 related protein